MIRELYNMSKHLENDADDSLIHISDCTMIGGEYDAET